MASLVAAPWLAVDGAFSAALGILGCHSPEHLASAGTAVAAALAAAELAWMVLEGSGGA